MVGDIATMKKAAPVVALALLLFGFTSLRNVVANAPALNKELVITTVTNRDRLDNAQAMYDPGTYLATIGSGYLYGDLVLALGDDGGPAPTDVAFDRMRNARTYLEESLRNDPSNGPAWYLYAQALTAVGDMSEAEHAIEMSWKYAPHSPRVAFQRIFSIQLLREATGDPKALAHIVESDTLVVQTHLPDLIKELPF